MAKTWMAHPGPPSTTRQEARFLQPIGTVSLPIHTSWLATVLGSNGPNGQAFDGLEMIIIGDGCDDPPDACRIKRKALALLDGLDAP